MTADEWLKTNDKHPVEITHGGYDYKWNWLVEEDGDAEDDCYYATLPDDILRHLPGRVWSGGRVYDTKEEALEAFREAYAKWRGETDAPE